MFLPVKGFYVPLERLIRPCLGPELCGGPAILLLLAPLRDRRDAPLTPKGVRAESHPT